MEFVLYRALSRLRMSNGHIPVRRHGIAHVEMYDVTADELDRIERESSDVGLDFQISLFCLTLGCSFLIALIFSPPPTNAIKTFIVFVILTSIGFLMGFIFFIKWFRGRRTFSSTLQKIRERQIGPVGEKGRELQPSELQALPSEESSGPEGS